MIYLVTIIIFCSQLISIISSISSCQTTLASMACHKKTVKGNIMTCDGRNDKMMPVTNNNVIQYLVLTNFHFSRLEKYNFTKFKDVECLSIIDAPYLKKIDPNTFEQMPKLTDLTIQNSAISDLHFLHKTKLNALMITKNKNLRKVNIYGERKTNLEQIKDIILSDNRINEFDSMFINSIRHVEVLDLGYNELKDLDFHAIEEYLDKLRTLKLNDNNFQTINKTTKNLFKRLKELMLAGNPFHCNCNLKWLKTFFVVKSDKQLDYAKVACQSPTRTLLSKERRFPCSAPRIPSVDTVRIKNGYHVNCSAYAEPAPTLTITLFDGQRVVIPPSPDMSVTETRSPHVFATRGGYLRCTADNVLNSTTRQDSVPLLSSGAEHLQASLASLVLLISMVQVFLKIEL